MEASLSVAPPWIALAPSLIGIHEGDDTDVRRLTVVSARCRYSITDQIAGQPNSLIAKEAIDPCARPCVPDVGCVWPGRDPQCPFALAQEHQAAPWRHELRRANLLAVIMPIRERQRPLICTMREAPVRHAANLASIAAGGGTT
jgi:hypothetical protein